MMKCEIIADSINSCGNRLTTFILEYPRFIHSEILTHRVFSKNAASSRAIPIEKMIQQVIDNPAMPEFWGKNQSGMQANEELNNEIKEVLGIGEFLDNEQKPYKVNISDKELAKEVWLAARDKAIYFVKQLNKIGLHKQICNRILEPWFNIRIILSGTEFENFFALRAHKDAQPELQKLAYLMLKQYNELKPRELKDGEWHIPFGDRFDNEKYKELLSKCENNIMCGAGGKCFNPSDLKEDVKIRVAISRCARISYFNYEGKDDYEADIKLCDRLFGSNPKHLSPTEHVAMALDKSERIGNFTGFKQYRYFFENQNLKDERVKK